MVQILFLDDFNAHAVKMKHNMLYYYFINFVCSFFPCVKLYVIYIKSFLVRVFCNAYLILLLQLLASRHEHGYWGSRGMTVDGVRNEICVTFFFAEQAKRTGFDTVASDFGFRLRMVLSTESKGTKGSKILPSCYEVSTKNRIRMTY